jgi:UDP-2,3-diacylglucosamine pyrophosphatase LpxH
MSIVKLVVSDLHLGDGSTPFESFGERQQAAFEGLLAATSSATGLWSQADQVELIINGDCFDFLFIPPYITQRDLNQFVAMQQVEKIITAHTPFFAALRNFLASPGHSVTFIAGNHDIELCFPEVQMLICTAIVGQPEDARVVFCPDRFYRPLADLYIEHGNFYDFWNHASEGLWDEEGKCLPARSGTIIQPVGSLYFQCVTREISLRHPYFDHLEPPMNPTCQIALLCVLEPDLILEMGRRTMEMLSYPRQAVANLTPEERDQPVRLFEEMMLDFAAFREDMATHKGDWHPTNESVQVSMKEMMEFMRLREGLTLPLLEAVAAICAIASEGEGEDIAPGMLDVLRRDPALRYALAGHTHLLRHDSLDGESRHYLNTASWTARYALPSPDEVTPDLVDWLRETDWQHIPLREVTQFVFALVIAEEDAPSYVKLCAWEGGLDGSYHILS